MPKIDLMEGEEVEFKQQWTDRALEDLAVFANTRGGTLLIGVRKDGEVVGAAADDAEIERVANVAMGLNDRQVQAVLHVKAHGSIGNKEYRELARVRERTATTELGDLVAKGILERIGSTGRGTRYAARKAQMAQ